jgi:hypothetical protein
LIYSCAGCVDASLLTRRQRWAAIGEVMPGTIKATSPSMQFRADAFLTERSDKIWQLRKDGEAYENRIAVEIGRMLVECRDHIKHGDWGTYLDQEFAWSDQQARRYIHAYEVSIGKFNELVDFAMPAHALFMLGAPKTPDAARATVLAEAKAGKVVNLASVKAAIAAAANHAPRAKPPTPSPAKHNATRLAQGETAAVSSPPPQLPAPLTGNDTDPETTAAECKALACVRSLQETWDEAPVEERRSVLAALPEVELIELLPRRMREMLDLAMEPLRKAPALASDDDAGGGIPDFLKREKLH